ncbi:MAG: DUF922 domain-containing Zn-dependent protease [Chloroflexi bacterium]|nr:DUF922 domain-containing Zn-dependent protease [Chloroflexota bacterium]
MAQETDWRQLDQRLAGGAGQEDESRHRQVNAFSCLMIGGVLLGLVAGIIMLVVGLGVTDSNFALDLGTDPPTPDLADVDPLAVIPSGRIDIELPDNATVEVSSATQYYRLTGTTEEQIQTQLFSRAAANQHAIATTQYTLDASWQYRQASGTCGVRTVIVGLDLLYTYPQWRPTGPVTTSVTNTWETFFDRVVEHEQYHAEVALWCARRLAQVVLEIPNQNSCTSVDQLVRTAVQDMFDECDGYQWAFDQEQGYISFPP